MRKVKLTPVHWPSFYFKFESIATASPPPHSGGQSRDGQLQCQGWWGRTTRGYKNRKKKKEKRNTAWRLVYGVTKWTQRGIERVAGGGPVGSIRWTLSQPASSKTHQHCPQTEPNGQSWRKKQTSWHIQHWVNNCFLINHVHFHFLVNKERKGLFIYHFIWIHFQLCTFCD